MLVSGDKLGEDMKLGGGAVMGMCASCAVTPCMSASRSRETNLTLHVPAAVITVCG